MLFESQHECCTADVTSVRDHPDVASRNVHYHFSLIMQYVVLGGGSTSPNFR